MTELERALARDQQHRPILMWSVVIGIVASVVLAPVILSAMPPTSLRGGALGVLVLPFAGCYALGWLVYRVLNAARR